MSAHSKDESSPKRRSIDPEAKVEAIFEAALAAFAEHGFHGATTDMIAAKAGVGAGTVYRHFADKDDLVLRIYERVKGAAARLVFADDSPDLAPEERLRRVWTNVARAMIEHKREFFFTEQFNGSPYVRAIPPAARAAFAGPLDAIVGEGKKTGVVKDLPSAAFEALFFGPATALARMHHLGLAQADEAILAVTLEGCLKAVRP